MLKLKHSNKSEMRLLVEFKFYGSGMIIENQADPAVLEVIAGAGKYDLFLF